MKRLLAVVLVLVLGSQCQAALEDAISATCRMITPTRGGGNDVGSGFCIANDPEVWVVTNAHVVKDGTTHYSEWYSDGNKSTKVPLTLVWKWYDPPTVKHRRRIDFAILKVDRAWFGDRVPFAVQFPPAGYVAPKGSMVWTVGCPGGAAPTALRSTVAGHEQDGASIKLLPKVEMGRSGSGVFDNSGTYLLGLVDSCDPDSGPYKGPYGYALDHSRVRALLSPMSARQETRLFDRLRGGSGGFCQNGICGNRGGGQQQQATPPPGTGQAYPQLPPLKGIDDVPPLPQGPTAGEVDNLRERLEYLELNQRTLVDGLNEKEAKLQALFGEDYALLKEMAANATAAKTAADLATAKAEDAKEGVGVLTGALLAVPETVDAAVESATADLKEKAGLVDRLKTRLDNSDLKTAAAAKKVLDVAGTVKTLGGKLTPWSLAARFGWMPVGLVIALLALWGRIEWKRRTGQEFRTKTGEVLSRGTGAVANVADVAKDYVQDKLETGVRALLGKARAIKASRDEKDAMAEAAELLGEAAKEA